MTYLALIILGSQSYQIPSNEIETNGNFEWERGRVWMGLELIRQLDDQYVLAAHPVLRRCRRLPPPQSSTSATCTKHQGPKVRQSLLEWGRMLNQFKHWLNEIGANNASYKIIHLAALPVVQRRLLHQAHLQQERATLTRYLDRCRC